LDRKGDRRKERSRVPEGRNTCYAVAQKLTVVGEAAARLTPEITGRYTSVAWADIVGLRNILVHEYFGIHWPLVWQTAVDHAPALGSEIAAILRSESSE
jgi:uncharacterized protein with HEPN domain